MDNFIIIAVIVVILAIAVISSVRRIKSKSCCSGGGSKALVEKKTLAGPVVMKKTIFIDGMHCDNCKAAVERKINRMDGALCKVNLKKNTALVQLTRDISDEELTRAVGELDFTVTKITSEVI
ncbi:MAG: heavy-metal-associated domain-containing protein [Ruminiclostridium sp.]|nr:heavy-metal-associated domain-containing protein [Ruminiclostridium sp.]